MRSARVTLASNARGRRFETQEFSDWGDADKTDAAIDTSPDGVSEPKEEPDRR